MVDTLIDDAIGYNKSAHPNEAAINIKKAEAEEVEVDKKEMEEKTKQVEGQIEKVKKKLEEVKQVIDDFAKNQKLDDAQNKKRNTSG